MGQIRKSLVETIRVRVVPLSGRPHDDDSARRDLLISVLDILRDDDEDVPSLENLKQRVAEQVAEPNPLLWAAQNKDTNVILLHKIENDEQLKQALEANDDDDTAAVVVCSVLPDEHTWFHHRSEGDISNGQETTLQQMPFWKTTAILMTATAIAWISLMWVAAAVPPFPFFGYWGSYRHHSTTVGVQTLGTWISSPSEPMKECSIDPERGMGSCEALGGGQKSHQESNTDQRSPTKIITNHKDASYAEDRRASTPSPLSVTATRPSENKRPAVQKVLRFKPHEAVVKGRHVQVRMNPYPMVLFYHKSNRAIWKLGPEHNLHGQYRIEARVARKGPWPTWLHVGIVTNNNEYDEDDNDDDWLWDKSAKQFRDVLTPVQIPATGSWNQFQWMELGEVSFPTTPPTTTQPSSHHSMALVVTARGYNKNVGVDFQELHLTLTKEGDPQDEETEK